MAGEGSTHYYWTNQARLVAGLLTAAYRVSCNTYVDHPTGWGRDGDSIDCWGREGRGTAILGEVGDNLAAYCLSADSPFDVDWLIWAGWIWSRGGGWSEYTDPTDQHFDHVHLTLVP